MLGGTVSCRAQQHSGLASNRTISPIVTPSLNTAVVCKGFRAFCRSVASIATTYIRVVHDQCNDDPLASNEAGQQLIQAANDLLVARGIFDQDFVDSVSTTFCSDLLDVGAKGLTPNGQRIYLDEYWLDKDLVDVAIVMAHEYTHIQQWNRMGAWKFKCHYATVVLNGGGTGPTDNNWIEREAYDFAEAMAECIESEINCPGDARDL